MSDLLEVVLAPVSLPHLSQPAGRVQTGSHDRRLVGVQVRRASADLPDLVPRLSRGKHRSPRKGACFMEMASYLAGERWSDHPGCTHPLLASVARLVNDLTTEPNRSRLVQLIPSVIGLTTHDPRADVRIALRSAQSALPVASGERQNALAVSVLTADRMLATLEGRPSDRLSAASGRALDSAPDAARWARRFANGLDASIAGFRRFGAPTTVRLAVVGIAEACVPDPDERLSELLVGAIEECAAVCGRKPDTTSVYVAT
jgi:hypothetical protein